MVENSPNNCELAAAGALALQRSLQHALEHFRAIVQGSDDAIISKSLDGVVISWNQGAARIFGYTAQEMLGRPIQTLLPPDRADEEQDILRRIRSGETVEHFETVRLRKDGKLIDVSVTISPIRDGAGVIVGASKIARDISFEVTAKAQLRLTSSVLTNTSEGILITDKKGLIVEVNGAFTRITGYSKEEVIGKDPQLFRSGRQSPGTFRTMRRALMRLGEWKGEIWSRRKDADAYSAFLTVSSVCGAHGEVENYVVLFSDITPLKLQREQLEHGAYFDALTDLPNRLLLSDRLHQAMANCLRHDQMLAVLYLDLDGFKTINDSYGHGCGDEMLIAVSRQMRAACAQPVVVQGHMLSVSASIGVTLFPADDTEVDQLMRHADQAMYEAKRSGKNRFHLFDAAQDAEVKHLVTSQTRVERALAQHELVLYYQPKVNMRTGAVVGAEALIRWQHPERGLLAPGTFLPMIEKHALNEAVGAWVLQTAVAQMASWLATRRCTGACWTWRYWKPAPWKTWCRCRKSSTTATTSAWRSRWTTLARVTRR